MKYLDRINQTTEDKAKENNTLVAETAKLSLQTAMLNIKKSIANNKQLLEQEKSNKNYNPSEIYKLQCLIDLSTKELNYLVELEKTEFTNEV